MYWKTMKIVNKFLKDSPLTIFTCFCSFMWFIRSLLYISFILHHQCTLKTVCERFLSELGFNMSNHVIFSLDPKTISHSFMWTMIRLLSSKSLAICCKLRLTGIDFNISLFHYEWVAETKLKKRSVYCINLPLNLVILI